LSREAWYKNEILSV